jgi:lipid-binding SYLF domain-containing protein
MSHVLGSIQRTLGIAIAFVVLAVVTQPAGADTAAEIRRDVHAALDKLYDRSPFARVLAETARGILVFPNVVQAGLVIGGQYGEGALVKGGQVVAYYNTLGASYGLQAGAQSYGYALFLMSEQALAYLDKSSGWEIGVGPTVVVVDEGMAKSLTTTTLSEDIYAFVFGQKGLMAGIGLQGSKITRIDKY